MSVPRKLGDFEVMRRIGTGGTAEVFLATKRGAKGTEKRLVVKRLLPEHARSDRVRTMFIHEAHLAMGLAHPNLVHVYELTDVPDGGLLLSMEYVDGADLGRILAEVKKRGERLPVPVALRIVEQAARGLHYAHEHRDHDGAPLAIVHRDISPQNLLVSRDGVVKVADLGVASARMVRDQTGVQPGKLRYMSPEQARGEKVDRRCDVFALGVVLYEILRLVPLYGDRRGAALARAVAQRRFDPPLAEAPDIPPDVLPVLEQALAEDPAHRTKTARDLAEALAQIAFARGTHADEAAVEAAVAPFIDSAGEIPAARSGTSDLRVSPAGGTSGSGTSETVTDEVPTRAGTPQARPRAPSPPAASGASPGDAFDRYVLQERIGRGGMAEVFRARDTKLGREVALKLLRTDSDDASRDRMMREAQSAATFEHPGSVVVFDVGEHGGVPFIAMELVRGRTLAAYLGDANVPIGRRIRWSVAIARVLSAAHRAGLVHRDVKPSNVMIRDDGEVKVLDFGVARRRPKDAAEAAAADLTAVGMIVGTPGYASPEQLRGDAVDGRADQFAWAVTTYELLAGRRPWTGDSTSVLIAQVLLHPFAPLRDEAPSVPAPVAAAIERALAREPEARFASLDEAAGALLPFGETDPQPVPRAPLAPVAALSVRDTDMASAQALRPSSIPDTSSRTSRAPGSIVVVRRSRLRAAVFGAAALIGGAAAWYLAAGPRGPAAPPPGPPVVASVRCAPATVQGDPDPDVARALGIGACARLGVALEVPWADPSATQTLGVRAEIHSDRTHVDLAIAGREASAEATVPLRAVDLAVEQLAAQLAAPPLTPSQIQAWGAKDDAGARRIARVFHRRDLRISAGIGAEAVRLVETDPESPFSHLLVLMVAAGSGDMLQKGRDRVLERIDRLPPSRQHLVRGLLLSYPAEIDRKEAARLVRQSYAEAPTDSEAVSLYVVLALRMGLPEAFGVLDRMVADHPTHSIVPLENAIIRAPDDDVARGERYARRWIEIFPEGRASAPVVQAFTRAGKLDEARAALDFGRRLGLTSMGDVLMYDGAAMDIDLSALDAVRARDHAKALLADPRPYARMQGVEGDVSALFLQGHAAEALLALAGGAKLGADTGYSQGTAHLLVRALAASRWLGRTVLDPSQTEWLAHTAAAQDQLLRVVRAEALIGLALLAKGSDAERDRKATLAAIEAEAAGTGEDRLLHDDLSMLTVPLVRAVRGDRAATQVYRSAEHARPIVRIRASIDAGLAFEALGDASAAERAYAIAADPALARESGLERVIAQVRLHKLFPKGMRPAIADHGLYAKIAAAADPGLLAAIEKTK